MTSTTTSQKQRILHLLQAHHDGVTALDALRECGSFRCAARISDLRGEGYNISTTMERTPSGKRVARYRLVGPTLFESWPLW